MGTRVGEDRELAVLDFILKCWLEFHNIFDLCILFYYIKLPINYNTFSKYVLWLLLCRFLFFFRWAYHWCHIYKVHGIFLKIYYLMHNNILMFGWCIFYWVKFYLELQPEMSAILSLVVTLLPHSCGLSYNIVFLTWLFNLKLVAVVSWKIQ